MLSKEEIAVFPDEYEVFYKKYECKDIVPLKEQALLSIGLQAKLDAVREYCTDQEINAISPTDYDFAVKILAILDGDT